MEKAEAKDIFKLHQGKCPVCPHVSKHSYYFAKHVKAHDERMPPQVDEEHKAKQMEKVAAKEIFNLHQGICPVCPHVFKHSYHFAKHVKAHDDRMPPQVDEGHKAKRSKDEVSGEITDIGKNKRKEEKCQTCGKVFKSRECLNSHIVEHAVMSQCTRILCPHCPRQFVRNEENSINRKHLLQHIEQHDNNESRMYTCLICEGKFKNYPEYAWHQENEKDCDWADSEKEKRSGDHGNDEDEDESYPEKDAEMSADEDSDRSASSH